MDNETQYYNQSQLWTEVAEYQKNVREDITRFIPEDVKTILDVGCGSGYIINSLAEKYDCTGIDISETALTQVTVKKFIGSAEDLPFPDESFDLVMINDVLEHLPESVFTKTLAELRRVAKKYILITVPFMENLNAGMTCCGKCGTVYHITHHIRAFNLNSLLDLYHGELKPSVLIYSGSEHDIQDITQYELRANLHLYTTWDKAMCPVCGCNASTGIRKDAEVSPYYHGITDIPRDIPFQPPMRNECISIFRKVPEVSSLSDSGIELMLDGRKSNLEYFIKDGKSVVHSDLSGSYCALTFAANGILNVFPRPLLISPGDYLVPCWFNNMIFNRNENIGVPILFQLLLRKHIAKEDEIADLKAEIVHLKNAVSEIQEIKSEIQEIKSEIQEIKSEITAIQTQLQQLRAVLAKMFQQRSVEVTWSEQRSIIEDISLPDHHAEQKNDGKRHFLVVCHDQDIDRRIIQQIESLNKMGWSGVLISLSFDSEDHIEEKTGYLVHWIGLKHIVPGCRIYWLRQHMQYWNKRIFGKLPLLPRIVSKFSSFLCRVLARLYYQCGPIKYPLPFDLAFYRAAEKYPADLILAEDLPALKASAILKKQWNCRLIFDSHEFYPEQKVFSSRQKKIMHGVTKRFIGDCDEVITVSDGIAEKFAEFYGIKKPHVIHNVTLMENTEKSNKFHAELKLAEDQIIILYQGGIIPERNIENVLNGFLAAAPANAHLVFLGPAAPQFLEKLKKIAGPALDKSVHFLKAVPREELLAYTASADFGIIPYKVIDLNTKYCMPNKFFEFIQAGLPILSNNLIEIEKILNDIGGGGMIHDLNSPKNVAEAIKTMLTRDLKHDHEVLLSAREKLSWNTESKVFEDIVKEGMKA